MNYLGNFLGVQPQRRCVEQVYGTSGSQVGQRQVREVVDGNKCPIARATFCDLAKQIDSRSMIEWPGAINDEKYGTFGITIDDIRVSRDFG